MHPKEGQGPGEGHIDIDLTPGLGEFYFLRHGTRLDQIDYNWRLSSSTPYDTPLARIGFVQSQLAGQAIVGHGLCPTKRASSSTCDERNSTQKSHRRYIIHSSPFLRCVQTSLALASTLARESGHKPLLRIDCCLGEWMTPDYFKDIQCPPAMTEMASDACYRLSQNLRYLNRQSSVSLDMSNSTSNRASNTVPFIELGLGIDDIELDLSWKSTLLGDGGKYGEDWPEMHTRFRESLGNLIKYYSFMSKDHNLGPANSEERDPIVILVTHGAGCNAMIGAVTGRPVLVDVGLAALSHAVMKTARRPDPDSKVVERNFKIPENYCLLMSASSSHLAPLASPKSNSNGQWSNLDTNAKNSIGRSGSWHKAVGRPVSLHGARDGLWSSTTSSPQGSRSLSVSQQSLALQPSSAVPGEPNVNLTEMFANKGRQRSSTTSV